MIWWSSYVKSYSRAHNTLKISSSNTNTYPTRVPICYHRLFQNSLQLTGFRETLQKAIIFHTFWCINLSLQLIPFLRLLWSHSHSGPSPYLSVLPCWSNPSVAPKQNQPTSFQWVMRNSRKISPPTSGIKLWISNLMSSFHPFHSFCQKERLL